MSSPAGFCECGCGEPTSIIRENVASRGLVKGEYRRFVNGHHGRKHKGPEYVEEDRGYETQCWIWQHAMSSATGYGVSHRRPAHRVYYERYVGPIPPGLHLDHLCRVTECVNPEHLEPVTVAVNQQRGSGAKLTPDQVRWIRENAGVVTQRDMSDQLGVSIWAVRKVMQGRTWRNVT